MSTSDKPDLFDELWIDNKFDEVLSELKRQIEKLSRATSRYSSQLAYLKYLHSTSQLSTLSYNPKDEPRTDLGQKGDFFFSLQQRRFCASRKFKQAWLTLKTNFHLEDYELLSVIGIFILHELFHFEQRLTGEQHGDIRSAQSVLRVIDYHADANAVLSLLFLSAEYAEFWGPKEPVTPGVHWQSIYSAAVKAQLRHIYTFSLMEEEVAWNPSTFMRHVVWHYQYHRISQFRSNAYFQEAQLLFEPGISIRSLQQADWDGAMPRITKHWPKTEEDAIRGVLDGFSIKLERETKDRDKLWLAAPNYWGVAKVFRFTPKIPKSYAYLFEGVFEGNTSKTDTFFLDLFDEYPELTGVWKLDPTGDPSPPTRPFTGEEKLVLADDAPNLLKWAANYTQEQGTRYLPVRATAGSDPLPPGEGAVRTSG